MEQLEERVSTSALHDTSTRQGDDTSECHPKTRRRLLQQLVDSTIGSQHRVNWFNGPAGAGKTAIMRSLAVELDNHNRMLAGFHFFRSDAMRNTLKHFIPTLAYQVAQNFPTSSSYIQQSIRDEPLIFKKSIRTQMKKLIIDPLLSAHAVNPNAEFPKVIIIDGLDECEAPGQREFLEVLLPTLLSQLSELHLTFYIASRPETLIKNEFSASPLSAVTNRVFLEPSEEDIREFLAFEFDKINERHPRLKIKYGGRWPRKKDFELIVAKSSGYFILAKTATRYINPDVLRGRQPDERLRHILEALQAEPYRPLDAMYLSILRQHAPTDNAGFEEYRKIIALICLPFAIDYPAWAKTSGPDNVFQFVFGMDRSSVEELISGLGSLVYFTANANGHPRIHHASFPDFISNRERSAEYFMDSGGLHEELACKIIEAGFKVAPITGLTLDTSLELMHHLTRAKFSDAIGWVLCDINWALVPDDTDMDDRVWFMLMLFAVTEKACQNPEFPSMILHRDVFLKKCREDIIPRMDRYSNWIADDLYSVMFCILNGVMAEKGIAVPDALFLHTTTCIQQTALPRARPCAGCQNHSPLSSKAITGVKRSYIGFAIYHFLVHLVGPEVVNTWLLAFLDDRFPLRNTHVLLSHFDVSSVRGQKKRIRPSHLIRWEDLRDRDQLLGTLPHSAPNQRLLDVLWAACLDESDNLVENWKNSEYSLEWNTEDQNTDEHMDQSEAEDEVAEEDNDESDSSDKEAAKDRSIALTKTQTHGSAAVQLVDIYISRIASSMGPSASEPVHDEGEESLTPEPESAPTTDSEEAMSDSDLSSISFDDGHSRSIWFGTKFILRYFNLCKREGLQPTSCDETLWAEYSDLVTYEDETPPVSSGPGRDDDGPQQAETFSAPPMADEGRPSAFVQVTHHPPTVPIMEPEEAGKPPLQEKTRKRDFWRRLLPS